jgi:uncharacterized protein (UPF0335 family)
MSDVSSATNIPAPPARGHNSKGLSVEGAHLMSVIERVERLEEDKKSVNDEIKDVFSEAKGNGYDVKIVRKILAMRKQDPNKRREEEDVLETYLQALGMQI